MIKKATKPLFTGSEWDVKDLHSMWDIINQIGTEELNLTYAEPRIEIVTYEQMIDAYSYTGMPLMYNHWSFGKQSAQIQKAYANNEQGLAYEMVINTDPMVTHIMENNSATMQALVLAHAVVGHGSFFKNNYLFKMWTNPKTIIPYLQYAKSYIEKCEEEYGYYQVTSLLDACHSLAGYGVDRYRKREKRKKKDHMKRIQEWQDYGENSQSELDITLPYKTTRKKDRHITNTIEKLKYRSEITLPEENILYFIEKHSRGLKGWEKEIVRIVRKVEQYFYPQRQTKIMNEGWATFVHHHIMTRLWELGYITEGSYLEFLHSHSAIVGQVTHESDHYGGLNPYAIGFSMFTDLKRMCENPTEQDKVECPSVAGKPWLPTLTGIMENYRDDGFLLQFLGSQVVNRYKLFVVESESNSDYYTISATHDSEDLGIVRKKLHEHYTLDNMIPSIEVQRVAKPNDKLVLRYRMVNDRILDSEETLKVLEYIESLWGGEVMLEFLDMSGDIVGTVFIGDDDE